MATNKRFFIRTAVRLGLVIIIALLTLPFSGCSKIENLSNSGSFISVEDITGKDLDAKASHTAFSDVITTGSVYNDNGIITLRASTLDQSATPTDYQDVIIDQIDIEYSRADGRNVQGQDIPYSFSQQMSVKLTVGKLVPVDFVLVTHNAKLEMPLVELTNYGAEHILKLEAKVTVHAKDVAGNRVAPAVANLSVWCANFADPKPVTTKSTNSGGDTN